MVDVIEKCIKCKKQVIHYEKLGSSAYLCNECSTKEWLDYMTLGGEWTKEANIALKLLDQWDEQIYNLSQHIEALETKLHKSRKEIKYMNDELHQRDLERRLND